MRTGQKPKDLVRGHFQGQTPDDVLARVKQIAPTSHVSRVCDDEQVAEGPALAHPRTKALPLRAYLASALTGLAEHQRQEIFEISDRVNSICLEANIDLYEPRKQSDPVHNPEVPDDEVFKMDHDRVVTSDLLIHLCHYPSTGSGEELGFAYSSLVPIILLFPGHQRVSRMITGIPSLKIEISYEDPTDLDVLLSKRLFEIRPYLEERHVRREQGQINIVGERVQDLRLAAGLTREELAETVGLTTESIRHLEESVDSVSNPSLVHLRALASALKTTVAELIVPNLNEYILSQIQSSLYQRVPARFYSSMTPKDRNKLMRRYLYRVLDWLDKE